MSKDLKIAGGGSVYLVIPVSEAGREWIAETAPEDARFLGRGMAVEWRYLDGVIEAAREAGLEV